MSLLSPIVWKPKGMHQKTFDRLRKKEEELSDSINRMLYMRLSWMKGIKALRPFLAAMLPTLGGKTSSLDVFQPYPEKRTGNLALL